MQVRRRFIILSALIGAGFSALLSASETESVTALTVQPLTLDRAQFGITDAQWNRYRTLMQGEAGLYYRNISPVWVLGIYAKTPAERQRYAKLAATQEKARLDKLLAFNRAWIKANDTLNPGSPINGPLADQRQAALKQMASLDQLLGQMKTPIKREAPVQRIAFFTRIHGCDACNAQLKRLLASGQPLDIFLMDSGGDDAAIRQWASDHHIPKDRVTGRATRSSITLNHDAGTLASLNPSAHAPALFRRDGSHYQPMTIEALRR